MKPWDHDYSKPWTFAEINSVIDDLASQFPSIAKKLGGLKTMELGPESPPASYYEPPDQILDEDPNADLLCQECGAKWPCAEHYQ